MHLMGREDVYLLISVERSPGPDTVWRVQLMIQGTCIHRASALPSASFSWEGLWTDAKLLGEHLVLSSGGHGLTICIIRRLPCCRIDWCALLLLPSLLSARCFEQVTGRVHRFSR